MDIKAHRLTGIWEKSKGLIGKTEIQPVYFETRWGIHTIGMRVPIDVLILNDDNRVVKIISNLLPNRLVIWPPVYKKVLELPAGENNRLGIIIGVTVNIKPGI